MLGFIGQTVEGGWNDIANITSGIGKGAGTLVSGFFPTSQREKVAGGSPAPAEGAGLTYRPVLPENIGMHQTWSWSQKDWLTPNPYQEQFAIPTKTKESQELAAKVSAPESSWTKPWTDAAEQVWKGATGIAGPINEQLPNILLAKLGQAIGLQGAPVSDTKKREENPKGLMQNLQNIMDKGAETTKAYVGGILEQVKGLFNLGFGQTGGQPVFGIQHELGKGTKITVGMAIAGIIIALLLLGRKK